MQIEARALGQLAVRAGEQLREIDCERGMLGLRLPLDILRQRFCSRIGGTPPVDHPRVRVYDPIFAHLESLIQQALSVPIRARGDGDRISTASSRDLMSFQDDGF